MCGMCCPTDRKSCMECSNLFRFMPPSLQNICCTINTPHMSLTINTPYVNVPLWKEIRIQTADKSERPYSELNAGDAENVHGVEETAAAAGEDVKQQLTRFEWPLGRTSRCVRYRHMYRSNCVGEVNRVARRTAK